MAEITAQNKAESGVTLTFTSASSAATGDKWSNSGNELLLIKASGEGTVTITVTAQTTNASNEQYGTLTKANATDSISNGEIIMMGPFPTQAYNDSDGYAHVTTSSYSGISIAVIQL
jgi:hypothetical protein|tara:strand:+ start:350 stop:700 length:351 start_codon:yes stop_codon:yes gene_type:complete